MALQTLVLSDTSGSPTYSGGSYAVGGGAGVAHPPVQTIGTMTATSAADGSFTDTAGHGQIISHGTNLYVGDSGGQRAQRFTKGANGLYAYDSKCAASSALGAAVNLSLVEIDASRSQIHLGSHAQNVDSTWIGVWNLSSWPTLTTGNRVRSYGSNAAGSAAGKAVAGLSLTLDGDFAIVTSSAGDFRILRWNHTTAALAAEGTKSVAYQKFVSDGSSWFSGAQSSGAAEPGLWQISPSTFSGSNRLDTAGYSLINVRTNRPRQGFEFTCLGCFGGRVYGREPVFGRILGWNSTTRAYLDGFAWPGAASSSASYGHAPGTLNGNVGTNTSKFGFFVAPSTSYCSDIVLWSSNGDSSSNQSFLTAIPCSTSTVVWSKSTWTNGSASTLKALVPAGTNLSGEKIKIEYRKTPSGGSAGSWKTVPWDKLTSASYIEGLGDHTFSNGDLLEVRASMSIWDRQDGHAQLFGVRDKLVPTNLTITAYYDDINTALGVYTQAAPGLAAKARVAPGLAVKARVDL